MTLKDSWALGSVKAAPTASERVPAFLDRAARRRMRLRGMASPRARHTLVPRSLRSPTRRLVGNSVSPSTRLARVLLLLAPLAAACGGHSTNGNPGAFLGAYNVTIESGGKTDMDEMNIV